MSQNRYSSSFTSGKWYVSTTTDTGSWIETQKEELEVDGVMFRIGDRVVIKEDYVEEAIGFGIPKEAATSGGTISFVPSSVNGTFRVRFDNGDARWVKPYMLELEEEEVNLGEYADEGW